MLMLVYLLASKQKHEEHIIMALAVFGFVAIMLTISMIGAYLGVLQ